MIGEILGGVSALASLFGSVQSARQNELIDSNIERQKSELQTWYDREYNRSYLDTPEAKSVIRLLNDQIKDQLARQNQAGVIRGASDEAKVAMAERLNKSLGQYLSGLAEYGLRNKSLADRQYQALKQNLSQLELQNLTNKSAQWANLMKNAMNLGIGASMADALGSFDALDDKLLALLGKKKPSQSIIDWYRQTGKY